jgi:hypothetical protein
MIKSVELNAVTRVLKAFAVLSVDEIDTIFFFFTKGTYN